MSAKKHGAGHEGSKSKDHVHTRPAYLKRAHRDWRVWIIVLMIALMLVYVMTDNESLRPGLPDREPMPADVAP